ncbi:Uncharacterised protein [Mycobacterium tuberculosis]|nr:Uncharacterised protein [Mycobacterium tuberculosis]COY01830.1 Uncharacterised protein [Mycobacterium tuberculosis]
MGAPQSKRRGQHPNLRVLQGFQSDTPGAVVDGTAVVRVDQAVVPQFAALVDVGYARHGQREQLSGQRVAFGMRVEVGHKSGQLGRQRSVEHQIKPAVHVVLERPVRVVPRGVPCRLPDRLLGVSVQPAAQRGADLSTHWPHSEDVLPQKLSSHGIRGGRNGLGVADELGPQPRHLGQHADAGTHVLAAFGVVGGQCRHGPWPQPSTGGGPVMKLRGAHTKPARFSAHFIE